MNEILEMLYDDGAGTSSCGSMFCAVVTKLVLFNRCCSLLCWTGDFLLILLVATYSCLQCVGGDINESSMFTLLIVTRVGHETIVRCYYADWTDEAAPDQ